MKRSTAARTIWPRWSVGSGPEWAGFSVTMPGKHAALAFAAHRTPAADLVGAANTLLPGPDGWIAANTDVDGIVSARLRRIDERLDERANLVLLGAGGTAQAAVVAAQRIGDRRRSTPSSATRLGPINSEPRPSGPGSVSRPTRSARARRKRCSDSGCVLVSTLPPRAADAVAERVWPASTVVLDAVYAGWPTALARAVTQAGGTAISGVEILLHQAAEQVRLMTGRDAPLDAMRAALPR